MKYNNDSEDTSVKVQCELLDKNLTTTGFLFNCMCVLSCLC